MHPSDSNCGHCCRKIRKLGKEVIIKEKTLIVLIDLVFIKTSERSDISHDSKLNHRQFLTFTVFIILLFTVV